MKQRFLQAMLATALVCASLTSQAEDIDLFTGADISASDLPNVLFIVDNTANWNGPFTNEMAALANTFRDLPVDKFNIGIMLAAETGNPNSNISGGYVRAAIRRMDADNKAKYQAMIEAFDKVNDKGNGGRTNLSMSEAYFYFSGGRAYSGNSKAKADYSGNTCSGCNLTATQKAANNAVFALPGNALNSFAATSYNSPIVPGTCGKNFIIYISNGPNQGNDSDNTTANDFLRTAGGDTTEIPLSPSGSQSDPTDEWARFLKISSLGVKTFTIDVDPPTSGQGPGWSALLQSMAKVSGGKYTKVTTTASDISNAIRATLSEIQSVNTVFASVSLPVSVNTQGSYLNQVYVGVFRPDGGARPRWAGNLKQYKLKRDGTNDLKLVDADEVSAVNTTTGFITECARSFWTPTTPDTYWAFNPQGACIPPAGLAANAYKISNFPDGNVVEKGGAGFKLRSSSGRMLKTCPPNSSVCSTLTDFDTGNTAITQASLGASSSTERDSFINWGRGDDLQDENDDKNFVEKRPSVHGDVVHSRPVALNFGTDASPKIGVFYGANDGVLRAVNGNRDSSGNIGTITPGSELWAFLPPEFYGSLKRLFDNAPMINYPTVPEGVGAMPKSYGPDGPVTALFDGTERRIYSTMRRGGRTVYGFNVDPSNPAAVTGIWKLGCPNKTDDTGCTTGLSSLGQTWSAAMTMKATAVADPLVIFGGGYDDCEDGDPNTCSSSSKGDKVYVVNARTGALVKTFSTDRGVIADVAVVDDLSTGLADYAYVADLGGNVYRMNIGADPVANWSITKIASLGCSVPGSCTNNRKFMFEIDIIEDNGVFFLLLGSGDREKPLRKYSGAYNVSNYFFMIQDTPSNSEWLSSESANCGGQSVLCLNSLLFIDGSSTSNPTPAQLAEKKGWYLGLNPHEQVVTSSITIFGNTSFSTHEPQEAMAAACTTSLGTTRLYNISFKDAAPKSGARFAVLPPVGLPPSPVAGRVILDNGEEAIFCIGCSPDSPLQSTDPEPPPGFAPSEPNSRAFWYVEK